MKYITTINNQDYDIDLMDDHHAMIDGKVYQIDFQTVGTQPVFSLLIDGESFEAHVYPDEEVWQVVIRGELYRALVEDEREKRLRAALAGSPTERGEYFLKAPMPGLVVSIPVVEGQAVIKGEVLIVLESMKMQNELKSPRAGTVARIKVAAGERVEQKQTMLSVV
jgi:biotin carboxyl carrier protein